MSVIADLIAANADMTAAYADRSDTLAAFRKQNEAAERVNQLTGLAVGRCGAMHAHCLSVSQNSPARIKSSRAESLGTR